MNRKEYNKQYWIKNRECLLKKDREYYSKNKDKRKQYKIDNKEHIKVKMKEYKTKHRKKLNEYQRIYMKKYKLTERGKELLAKRFAVKRGIGFKKLFENPFDISEKIAWHHVTQNYVVAVPLYLHNLCNYFKDSMIHKESMLYIIKQIYPKFYYLD